VIGYATRQAKLSQRLSKKILTPNAALKIANKLTGGSYSI